MKTTDRIKAFMAMGVLLSNAVMADTIPLLKQGSNHWLNLSSPDHAHTIPYLGELRTLMVFVDFDNLKGSDNPHPPQAIAEKLLGIEENGHMKIVDFYQQQSGGNLSFKIDVDYEWMRLRKPKSKDYPGPIRPVKYIREALLLAQAKGYQLKNYPIVYVVAPRGMRRDSPTHYLRASELKGIDHPPKVIVTFGDDGQRSRIQHLVHETGHGMGLPDIYLYRRKDKAPDLTTPGPWDIMCDNWTAHYFCAWNRHLWKWMDDQRKVYLEKGEDTIQLAPIDAKTGIAMIVLPSEKFPAEVIVLENPTPWRASVSKGVLIYKVNGSVASGRGVMDLELPPGISNAKHPDALWQPGQTYRNVEAKVEVEVLESQEETFLVRVRKS